MLAFAAAVVLVAGVLAPALRDAEGFLTGDVVLVLGAAAALLALAVTRRDGWQAAGAWMALALLGQGAVLSLVDAGNGVGYQHLRLRPETGEWIRIIALGIVTGQAVAVLLRGRSAVRTAAGWLIERAGTSGAAVVTALFAVTAATLSPEIPTYLVELGWATALQALQVATILAAGAALPSGGVQAVRERVESWLAAPDGEGRDALPWLLAGWTVAVAALLSWVAYERHPHVPDEVVYLLHARYFAAGLLELPLPPVPAGFDIDLMTLDATRWFSPVPPGWPAMLAVGVLVGAPWLVNPVLAGFAVLLTPRVVRLVYGDARVARLTAVLLATSPWFLFMAMSYMTHTFTLVAALAAAWGTGRVVHQGGAGWLVVGGVGIGIVALIRPLEGLIVAATLGLWALPTAGSWARGVARTAGLAVVSFLTTAAVFPYNRHFTGRATHFPIMDYTDRVYGVGTNSMGFGPDRGLGWTAHDPFPGHGPIDVLVNGNVNLFQVNVELLGWSVGSILVLALLLVGRRWVRADAMMLMPVVLVIATHAFYWFSGGPDFGARYWYLILVPCLALAARGVLVLAEPDAAGGRVWPATAVLLAGVVFLFLPWRAVDKYHHYRGMRPDIRMLAEDGDFGDALVLVRGDRHPDYASAAVYNPLDLRGAGPIYAWDRNGEVRRAVLEAYPDRPVWLVDGPTVTGRGFEVVDGPVTDRARLLGR